MKQKKLFSKPLSSLLQGLTGIYLSSDPIITGLTLDSRTVKTGDVFFAVPGIQKDGRDFIHQAISQGASAILVEQLNNTFPSGNSQIPIIEIPHLSDSISQIAARFYDNPSSQLQIIGVTGTNGKTSCTHFIAQALKLNEEECGIIGTLGCGLNGHLQQTALTTPDAITIQKLLADFLAQGARYAAIEVSSHALKQGRVKAVNFDIGVFTNLSRDHLDYHLDMSDYANAKRLLFEHPGLGYGVVNADDPYGQKWLEQLVNKINVFSYSSKPRPLQMITNLAETYVHHAQVDMTGITASVHTPWGDAVLHNPRLLGHFYLDNLLAVVNVLGILGFPLQEIVSAITSLKGVAGRMETFTSKDKPLVVVDFAHTPDALQKVLTALQEIKQGNIWCVFGCGGDRDKGKRPLMGKIAEEYADQIVITDDNPRYEDPRSIVTEILQGITQTGKAVVEHNRRRAITHAINCAQPSDIVLIAGKGHETYQIIGDDREPFNDAVEVQKLLVETLT